MPSQNKTKTLKLSQWQGHEYVSFDDISEDNRKIDTAIEQVNTSLSNKIDRSEVQGMIGNVDLSGKVDKEAGKGLSTNDYSNVDKNKVNNLPTNTNSELNAIRGSITTLNSNVSTANAGLSNKVDKVTGKGLSTNDYTTNDRNKVNNLPVNTISEINALKQSVGSGKQTIATAINDLVGSTVATSSMTHGDLAVLIRNNIMNFQQNILEKLLPSHMSRLPDSKTKIFLYQKSASQNYTQTINVYTNLTSGVYYHVEHTDNRYSYYSYYIANATKTGGTGTLWVMKKNLESSINTSHKAVFLVVQGNVSVNFALYMYQHASDYRYELTKVE